MRGKQGLKALKGHIHSEITGLLAPYLKGDVSPEQVRKVEEHVPGCAECQEKLGLAMLIEAHGLPGWWEPQKNVKGRGSTDRIRNFGPSLR